MSALPESLRPWATELSLFPEDLALSLGAHVARLAAALGPLRARSEVAGGEPQGYDGLTRRGSPEWLLMSEWLMALEAPDEFVRRAAFGEQAFLRPAFRQPQGGRRVVALLDAGPDQLGAPRIAHLALLVVLARRAEAAGAGFAWGVLQSPPGKEPFTTVDAAAIGQWLKAASARPPSDEQLASWREALQWGRSPDDVWLVGGARLSRLQGSEGLSRVAVEEVIVPGVRRLAVEVRPASRPSREVVLELPPAPQCVRLLRDPFGTAVVAPVLDRRTVRALRFSADGLRLLLANGEGGVTAQALPQSPSATLPKPKHFLPPSGETVVAMGWRRHGGLLAVTLRERTLRVHGTLRGYSHGQRVTVPLPEDESLRLPRAGEPPLLAMTLLRRQGREQPLVWDAAGTLHELSWDPPSPTRFPVLSRVSALVECHGALLHVSRPVEGSSRMLRVGCESPGGEGLRVSLTLEGDGGAYFGQAKSSGLPLAVRQRPGCWWMMRDVRREEGTELSLPMGMRAVGLFSASGGLGLVALGQDQRTFYRVSPECVPEVLTVVPARVVTASVSNALPVLAWLTEKGEVGVWNFLHRALVFHSTPGGAP